jgi:hypothetical protein
MRFVGKGYDCATTTAGAQSLQLHRFRVNKYESLRLYNTSAVHPVDAYLTAHVGESIMT